MTAEGRKTSAESDGLGRQQRRRRPWISRKQHHAQPATVGGCTVQPSFLSRIIVVGIRRHIGRRMGLRGLLHTTLRQ